jgi:hypothetical protein
MKKEAVPKLEEQPFMVLVGQKITTYCRCYSALAPFESAILFIF